MIRERAGGGVVFRGFIFVGVTVFIRFIRVFVLECDFVVLKCKLYLVFIIDIFKVGCGVEGLKREGGERKRRYGKLFLEVLFCLR